MSLGDERAFVQSLQNPYKAAMEVSDKARKLCNKYEGLIESEAITHIVHNTEPDNKIYFNAKEEYIAMQIKEMFCYIDDKAICDAVYDSFYESKKKHNLIYIYNDISDEARQARVRILTRMLWYQLIAY